MSNELRSQIYHHFDDLDTDVLLDIWETNDRVEWSDTAFEIIQEILERRIDELPKQNPPILEHIPPKRTQKSFYEDIAIESYVDEMHAPVFYKPEEVLWLSFWLNRLAIAAIVITVLGNLPTLINILRSQIQDLANGVGSSLLSSVFTSVIGILVVGLTCAVYYFSLRGLAYVLRILMEMEFNSRSAR